MNPPQDGTVIIANFNLIEHDGECTGVETVCGATIRWDGELWVWSRSGMSVLQCLGDEICFHWWTNV